MDLYEHTPLHPMVYHHFSTLHRSAITGGIFETHQNQLNPFFLMVESHYLHMFVAKKMMPNHELCPFLGHVSPRIKARSLLRPSTRQADRFLGVDLVNDLDLSAPWRSQRFVPWSTVPSKYEEISAEIDYSGDGNESCCPKNVWKKHPISPCHPFWDNGCNIL